MKKLMFFGVCLSPDQETAQGRTCHMPTLQHACAEKRRLAGAGTHTRTNTRHPYDSCLRQDVNSVPKNRTQARTPGQTVKTNGHTWDNHICKRRIAGAVGTKPKDQAPTRRVRGTKISLQHGPCAHPGQQSRQHRTYVGRACLL